MQPKLIFSTPMADIHFKDGIVFVSYLPIVPTMEQAVSHIDAIKSHLKDYFPLAVLADVRNSKTISKEVREYLGKPENTEIIKAGAMLVGSPLTKLIGNLYLQFSKPKFPHKLFSEEDKPRIG